MRSHLVTFDGSTFMITDQSGDAGEREECVGLFWRDTRHLSEWQVLVDDTPLEPLTVRNVDYYSARIFGMLEHPKFGSTPDLTVHRDRLVGDGMHEDITVENHAPASRRVTVSVCYGSDFADLFEVKRRELTKRRVHTQVEDRCVRMSYRNNDFRRATEVRFSQPGTIGRERATFEIELEPHGRWDMCIEVACAEHDRLVPARVGHGDFGRLHPHMAMTLDDWFDDSPTVDCDVDDVSRIYRQSLLDLAALRFQPFDDDPGLSIPAGGLPWYSALLARDALLTSYMTLPFHPALAQGTLRALARLQAHADDAFTDAEPGKIAHELRRGELSATGVEPHSPYYGSHDATALFVVVLDEYVRWTGDRTLATVLEPAARAALDWMCGAADLDGDGLLEYRSRSERGLRNHSWKDSENSMLFADGTVAEPPIAGCEVQGYAYDAMRRGARLARDVWGDEQMASELEQRADTLKRRFDATFWVEHRRHPALGLDAQKRQIDSLTSNIGHLMWSGILDEQRARQVVDHLMSPEMFTGWGVRTMSSADNGYNPIEYHNGSVWPHDTAIVAEGLRRYGFRDEATRLATSVLDAAAAFEHRLPELFAGFSRRETDVIVEYPSAASPQAWSAAAPLLAMRTLLGLDVVDDRIEVDPWLPERIGRLAIAGLRVGERRVDVGSD